MKELEISGANRFAQYTKTRSGSRAIIIDQEKILLTHEVISDLWMIPGGGTERGETPEACCIRETEEETGFVVRPLRCFLILNEYYEDVRYISHYFICSILEKGSMRLTEAERVRGLTPVWMRLDEAAKLFSRHQEYAAVSEEKRGIYLREYLALTEYQKET